MTDKLYKLEMRVKQKKAGQMQVLENQYLLAKGERGKETLLRKMDEFIEKVQVDYDLASKVFPVVVFSYLRELPVRGDGTLGLNGLYHLYEKHLRLPPFGKWAVKKDEPPQAEQ